MILDNETILSDKQEVAGTGFSTDSFDAKQDRDIGIGEPLAFAIDIHERGGANGPLVVAIQTADNSSFTTGTAELAEIDIGAVTAPTRRVWFIPKDATVKRYLRVQYRRASGNRTATVTVALLHASGIEARGKYYPRGYTVS